jgi:hypothetical protein
MTPTPPAVRHDPHGSNARIARRTSPKLPDRLRDAAAYWLGLPLRWLYQMAHNGHGIVRVLDIIKLRPLPAGLVSTDHPWVTGLNPETGETIWQDNVIYRSPRTEDDQKLADDDVVLEATGKFLAERVRQSAVTPELPVGPKRRMPHGINYIHGSSHFNSGILIFNDFADGYRHITDRRFRKELYRFVKRERREVLFVFRNRDYQPREYAYFSCCMRTLFPWFCNPNGPRGRILWGNAAPFPAANLITGHWMRDVYALKRPGGTEAVVRKPIAVGQYFRDESYGLGRDRAIWPEKLLAWTTYWRVRLRGQKGGMFFVDRRETYRDQIERQSGRGIHESPVVPI